MSNEWSHGLFSCFEDCSTCELMRSSRLTDLATTFFFLAGILTWFCPCYVFGKNAEHLGESCILYALALFVPLLDLYCLVSVRGRIREQKGIEGTCLKDLLCVWCCGPCALVQEARVRAGASNFAHIYFAIPKYLPLFFRSPQPFSAGVAITWRPKHGSRMNCSALAR